MRILPLAFFLGFLIAQQPSPDARAERPSVSTAEAALAPLVRAHVEQAIRTRDYLKAEQILDLLQGSAGIQDTGCERVTHLMRPR